MKKPKFFPRVLCGVENSSIVKYTTYYRWAYESVENLWKLNILNGSQLYVDSLGTMVDKDGPQLSCVSTLFVNVSIEEQTKYHKNMLSFMQDIV